EFHQIKRWGIVRDHQIPVRRWSPPQRITSKSQLEIEVARFHIPLVDVSCEGIANEWMAPDADIRFEVGRIMVRQGRPGDRASPQGHVIAIGKAFVETKHALEILCQATAVAQYKLIPGQHGVEFQFRQGSEEEKLGALRLIEETNGLQFALEVARQVFEDLVKKGLLTLCGLQFMPALRNRLGDQARRMETC